jgi:hypothetical protein
MIARGITPIAAPLPCRKRNAISVRGALLRGSPVEVVVEDGFDRAISACADVDGALGGGFEALGAIRTGQPDDPQTGAKALFRVPTLFEDQFTQRRSRRADQARRRGCAQSSTPAA